MNFQSTLPVQRFQGLLAIEEMIRQWVPEGVQGEISLVHALTWPSHLQLRFDGFRHNASTLAVGPPFPESMLRCGVSARPVVKLLEGFLEEIAPGSIQYGAPTPVH